GFGVLATYACLIAHFAGTASENQIGSIDILVKIKCIADGIISDRKKTTRLIPLCKFLPSLPSAKSAFQAGLHRSGLSHWPFIIQLENIEGTSRGTVIQLAQSLRRHFLIHRIIEMLIILIVMISEVLGIGKGGVKTMSRAIHVKGISGPPFKVAIVLRFRAVPDI